MISIGKASGIIMRALVTDMNQPLGLAVGNALEVKQAVEVLRGEGPEDLRKLCLELSARMLVLGKVEKTVAGAMKILDKQLLSGNALAKFRKIIELQSGDARVADKPEKYLAASAKKLDICSTSNGYVSSFDTRAIGLAAVNIGAGRKTKEEKIDPSAGLILYKKIGDKVNKGEPLATMHYNSGRDWAGSKIMFEKAVTITSSKPKIPKLIYEEL
jgi:pyrimidine-nucleoside phosphorylase